MRSLLLIAALVLLAAPPAAAQPLDALDRAAHDPTVVAVVDGQPVTFGEVRRSFGLEPVWTSGQRTDEAYRAQLDRAVAERLLALEARRRGLDAEPYAASRLAALADREVIRTLYRREVLARVDVTEADLEAAYLRAKRRVRLEVVSTADSLRARAHAAALRDTAAAPLPPATGETRDTTDWLGFYDVDAAMQEVVFDLAPGETAGPLAVGGRFYVVRLLEGRRERFLSEHDFAEQRSRLERTLTEQRARPLAARFVAGIMDGRNVQLDRDGFAALGSALGAALEPAAPTLTEAEVARALNTPALRGDEVVVTWEGGRMTAREVLWAMSHLPASPLRAGRPLAPQLRAAVGRLVRDRVLAEHGRTLGLDTLAEVRREAAWAHDQFLSDRLREALRDAVDLTDEQLAAFRASDAFAEVDARLPADLARDDRAARALLRAHRLARREAETLARLHQTHAVTFYPERLRDRLRHPDRVLASRPVPMQVREVFQ